MVEHTQVELVGVHVNDVSLGLRLAIAHNLVGHVGETDSGVKWLDHLVCESDPRANLVCSHCLIRFARVIVLLLLNGETLPNYFL